MLSKAGLIWKTFSTQSTTQDRSTDGAPREVYLLVFDKRVLRIKHLATNRTRIPQLLLMSDLVEVQVTDRRVGIPTLVTAEGSRRFSRVDFPVFVEPGHVGKPLPTFLTLVDFFSGVNAHVYDETVTLCKRLPALVTAVGLLSAVDSLVLFQMVGRQIAVTTLIAVEGPFLQMD